MAEAVYYSDGVLVDHTGQALALTTQPSGGGGGEAGTLGGLSDVNVTGADINQVLAYAGEMWVPWDVYHAVLDGLRDSMLGQIPMFWMDGDVDGGWMVPATSLVACYRQSTSKISFYMNAEAVPVELSQVEQAPNRIGTLTMGPA